MKKLVAVLFVLGIACGAANAQVFGQEALYVGGTLPNVKAGTMGKLNLTGAEAFAFESSGGNAAISYKRILSYEYSIRHAHSAGDVPTGLVIAFLKQRHRRHFVTLTFKDDQGVSQVALFEISKQMPAVLIPVLAAKATQADASAHRAQRVLQYQ